MMKLIEIYNDINEEYPVSFNMDTFKSIRSYADKIKYVRENLGNPLGSGTARMVFNIDGTKVLKLAKNEKGVAQNEVESNYYSDSYWADILANVIDFDEKNYYWVEMEIAQKVRKSDFKRLYNVSFDDLGVYLRYRYLTSKNSPYAGEIDSDKLDEFNNNDFVVNITDYMLSNNVPYGDLVRISSYGLVKRKYGDVIVIIDFGITEDVHKQYYNKR
jgi:hypothetical protein